VALGATGSIPESFTEPSPDRAAAAVGGALDDELLFTLGTPASPGPEEQAQAAAAAVGGTLSGGLSDIGVYEVRWPSPQNLAARTAALESQPGVGAVTTFGLQNYEADTVSPHVSAGYDLPRWTWPYEQVQASGAWTTATGSNVGIGIIDGGNVFARHEDLNVVATLGQRYGPAVHATHVAGLACARGDNELGLTGIASGCPVTSIAIGGIQGFFLHVLTAMNEMVEQPDIEVVNISLGENADQACASSFEAEQFQAHATDAKALFRQLLDGIGSSIVWTFSAGNNCAPGVANPWGQNSDLDNVIDVGASNSDGSLASFSDYGAKVDVAAPGGIYVPSDTNGLMSSIVFPYDADGHCPSSCTSRYQEMAGTSMSAPIVAGIAALVREANPGLSAKEAGACIKQTAGIAPSGYTTGVSAKPVGYVRRFSVPAPDLPIVNAEAAVACAAPPTEEGGTPAGPEVVSVDYKGVARSGSQARISRDGRYVWFQSSANLLPGVMPEAQAVYVRDLATETTERIDLPQIRHDQAEELVTISPSGRFAAIRPAAGSASLYDRESREFTPIPRFVGYRYEAGLESDGDTMVLSPSSAGSIVDIYSISRNEVTHVPCPAGLSNGYLSTQINLDNDTFAGISSEGCRYLLSGYVLDLANGEAREAIAGHCNNLGNACVDALATDEGGVDVFAEILASGGSFNAYLNGNLIGTEARSICGLSESGRYAIAVIDGVLRSYDSQESQSTVISPTDGSDPYIYCNPQSVSANGTTAYTDGDTVLLAHAH
jgi:subtilisin family serine protease